MTSNDTAGRELAVAEIAERISIASPLRGDRAALRLMQIGAIAAVLAVSPLSPFDLDRFFVPKELVLHITAVGAWLLAGRKTTPARIDSLLAGYFALGSISLAFAPNPWLATRALAVTSSGILLFLSARRLREAGLERGMLGALALAVVIAASTALLQTYGLQSRLFAENRAPGGTLGNRNFVAHAAAFGLPLLIFASVRASRAGALLLSLGGVGTVCIALVLTRSRAAWLAGGVVAAAILVAIVLARPLRGDRRTWIRLALLAVVGICGAATAILVPNSLRWRSDNPYLESMRRVADYEEGSGRGRLIQYERSLRMAIRHPFLGVGPGNWPVVFPGHVPATDPSLNDSQPGMTFNPWPSSDWIAWISERGFPAAALLGLVFLGMFGSGVRQLSLHDDPSTPLLGAALIGVVAGAVVTGLFDAVLLTPLPTFLVWSAFGVLSPPPSRANRGTRHPVRGLLLLLIATVSAFGVLHSAAELTSMSLSTRGGRSSLEHATRIDPGNYRAHLRLARTGRRVDRCRHAHAAHALFPNARAAAELSRQCGDR